METSVTTQLTTPSQLIAQAIEKGLDVESLGKLMDLQERWEANQARKSFFQALSDFQKNCPVLRKNKTVAFNQTSYKYTQLSSIVQQTKNALSECGLTFRWETKDDGNSLVVTCIVTHRDGHSESTTMSASADKSGAKNDIQARGSAITYLQRYTLIGALGISTADQDTDGQVITKSADDLHKEYMAILNPLIQKDNKWRKFDPDNWKGERTPENYMKAIADLKQKSGVS